MKQFAINSFWFMLSCIFLLASLIPIGYIGIFVQTLFGGSNE